MTQETLGLDAPEMIAHEGSNSRKVFIKTYGCQMNVYDSVRMSDALAKDGYVQTEDMGEADLVLLNTCHIREKAGNGCPSLFENMTMLYTALWTCVECSDEERPKTNEEHADIDRRVMADIARDEGVR